MATSYDNKISQAVDFASKTGIKGFRFLIVALAPDGLLPFPLGEGDIFRGQILLLKDHPYNPEP